MELVAPRPQSTAAPRNRPLDGVRGYGMLMVLAYHIFVRRHVPGASVGVDLFFVLSGFLITALLIGERERSGRFTLREFYARRCLRIWPAFYAYLLACLIWALLFADPDARSSVLGTIGWVATYVPNVYEATGHDLFPAAGQMWSLGVEEQFYLLWPLTLLAVLAVVRSRRMAVAATFVLALALTALKWYLALSSAYMLGESSLPHLYFGTDMRAAEILIGCAAGMLRVWRPVHVPRYVANGLFASWASLVLFVLFEVSFVTAPYYLLQAPVAVLTAAVIYNATLSPTRSVDVVLGNRIASWIGVRSYSIYLWHLPIAFWVSDHYVPHAHLRAAGLVAAYVAAALTAGALSYRFIELPFLRLKDSRFRSKPERTWVVALARQEKTAKTT